MAGGHRHRSNRHPRPQTDGQHLMAGPPGAAAHQKTTGEDWRAERPVSRFHRNVQVFQGGAGGPGGLRRSLPPVQHQTDEKGEGPGRKGVLPD